MKEPTRTRRSLHELEKEHGLPSFLKSEEGENEANYVPSELELVIKAFRGIQKLPPNDPNSFFSIAAYHGHPFSGPGVTDKDNWWGGYCNHGNVLFPTWHRACLVRLEEALRSIKGCENVALPYWDELFDKETPLPKVLTSPTFTYGDGKVVSNPLFSYVLQQELKHNIPEDQNLYTKYEGYETKRYPQAGRVGTAVDRGTSATQNARYWDYGKNAELLNKNVSAWLYERHKFKGDGTDDNDSYEYSGRSQWLKCLWAPNYNVFSNNSDRKLYVGKAKPGDPLFAVSLEAPHDSTHLAIGAFSQSKHPHGDDQITGAFGEMGNNETAGFDPIFYLHHAFVDYAFWIWQNIHHQTEELKILKQDKHGNKYRGTFTATGLPNLAKGTELTADTPLFPFRRPDHTYVTSRYVTNIERDLHYKYDGKCSLEAHRNPSLHDGQGIDLRIVDIKRVHNINRLSYPGSFVIRTLVGLEGGEMTEIGREAVLSRQDVAGCQNCQNKLEIESFVPVYHGMLDAILGKGYDDKKVRYQVNIQLPDKTIEFPNVEIDPGTGPQLQDLW